LAALREYLTEAEVDRLMKAAKDGRYGQRDATLILIAFRHAHARITSVAHILDVVRPLLALHAPRARVAVKKASRSWPADYARQHARGGLAHSGHFYAFR
jgi:hypothetical protein